MKRSPASVISLLDVNVLLAITLRHHSAHAIASQWFHTLGSRQFATCALTQTGLVRLLSNRSLYEAKVSHNDAVRALGQLTAKANHVFWPMNIEYAQAVKPFQARISGHNQTTDAYLLGMALHHRQQLATLDQGLLFLAGSEFRESVELIA